jgi:hypothetical protein
LPPSDEDAQPDDHQDAEIDEIHPAILDDREEKLKFILPAGGEGRGAPPGRPPCP